MAILWRRQSKFKFLTGLQTKQLSLAGVNDDKLDLQAKVMNTTSRTTSLTGLTSFLGKGRHKHAVRNRKFASQMTVKQELSMALVGVEYCNMQITLTLGFLNRVCIDRLAWPLHGANSGELVTILKHQVTAKVLHLLR